MQKKILAIIGLLIFIAAIPIGVLLVQRTQEIRERAAPATNLSLTPVQASYDAGQTFTLSVNINTGTNLVAATELHITFNPQVVEAQKISAASFLPVVILPGTINNTAGQATITIGSQPTEPKTGTGTLATIKFRGKVAGSANIAFGSATKVTDAKDQNVLAGTSPSTITIAAVIPSPAAAATASPTSISSPSPIPTLEPTSTVKATSTAKSTTTVKASASPDLPVTGVSWPTVIAAAGGFALLIFGVILAF